MDPCIQIPFEPILQHTFLVESDHVHDLATRRSLACLLGYVVSTPSTWMSNRQDNIVSSTYAAEFSTLRTVKEEA